MANSILAWALLVSVCILLGSHFGPAHSLVMVSTAVFVVSVAWRTRTLSDLVKVVIVATLLGICAAPGPRSVFLIGTVSGYGTCAYASLVMIQLVGRPTSILRGVLVSAVVTLLALAAVYLSHFSNLDWSDDFFESYFLEYFFQTILTGHALSLWVITLGSALALSSAKRA